MPSKYANAELMKIPNFLHLTPVHIKKHCAALKSKFLFRFPSPITNVLILRLMTDDLGDCIAGYI